MPNCHFCKEPAGFFHFSHEKCKETHTDGLKHIRAIARSAIMGEDNLDHIENEFSRIAAGSFVSDEELRSYLQDIRGGEIEELESNGDFSEEKHRLLTLFSKKFFLLMDIQSYKDYSKKCIEKLAKDAAENGGDIESIREKIFRILDDVPVSKGEIEASLQEIWEKKVSSIIPDGIVTEEQANYLSNYLDTFGLQKESPAYRLLVMSCVLRDLTSGILPTQYGVDDHTKLQVNLSKNESIVWGFQNVPLYEEKTLRRYEGGSVGVSVRVAKGVYVHSSGFRGHPVDHETTVRIDTGYMAFTNKNIHFVGEHKAVKIPYSHVAGYAYYSNGIKVMKNGVSAKPFLFITGYGWFVSNLVQNIKNIE